jgi:hypothetical protein
LCLAQLMISLDVLIVNIALPQAATHGSHGRGMVLLIGSALVAALARGEPGPAVAAPASGLYRRPGALRRIGQPS